jgi:hypothetical protein
MDGIIATALILVGATLSLAAVLAAQRLWSSRRRRR